jgi:hypothetical protein
MYVDRTRTYLGIVEDNEDPKKLGRVRARVVDVYGEGIPTEDLPWASPWKDLNGNSVNIPERGKVVTVVFEQGNVYHPEFIYSEHYNINLEKKLKSLSGSNYTSMKSLIFDHKTQLYVNDDEGLKFDYKYNNINIIDDGINVNLKDNFQRLNLGDAHPDQQSVLGTNFLNWFDEFVDNLMGNMAGPFLGNLGAPVLPNPAFIACLQKYKALKYPKFLSDNIYMNDNKAINSVRNDTNADPNLRIDDSQSGDTWKSTVKENELAFKDPNSDFKPKPGNGTETPEATSPNGTPSSLSSGDGTETPDSIVTPPVGEINPDVKKIIDAMKSKSYKVEEKPYFLNIVGIRYQYEGQDYSNKFKDKLWAIWKNDRGEWESQNWPISTVPGLFMTKSKGIKMKSWCAENRVKGLGVMVPSQYLNIYKFFESELPESEVKMKARPTFRANGMQLAYRDTNWDSDKMTFNNKNNPDKGNHGMHIHRGFPGGSDVNNWSEGCQVFSRDSDFKQLCNFARNHIGKHGNSFHYTLMMSVDVQ